MNSQSSRKAYADYLDAVCLPTERDMSTGEHRYTPEAITKMQHAMLDALRGDDPLPEEMRMHLAFALEDVCEGFISDLLQPVKRGGGRERPIAKHMQEAAIRYLRWVEDGRIPDKRPTATVAEAFDVTTRTVRGWKTAWSDSPTPEVHDEFGADAVTRFMRATGKQYRRFIPKPKLKGW